MLAFINIALEIQRIRGCCLKADAETLKQFQGWHILLGMIIILLLKW